MLRLLRPPFVRWLFLLSASLALAACAQDGPGPGTAGHAVGPDAVESLASSARTTLTLNDTDGVVAGPATLVATIRRRDNNRPVSGLTVSFYIDGRHMGNAVTGATGQAFRSFNLRQLFRAGLHTSRASFSGNAAYSSSSDLAHFNVTKGVAYFKSSGLPFVPTGTTKRITLRMEDRNNDAIAGRRLWVSVNGGTEQRYTTNAGGYFEFTVNVKRGDNTAKVRFETGDNYFNAKTQTLTVVVGT